jgi:signal transduction histidine kinase
VERAPRRRASAGLWVAAGLIAAGVTSVSVDAPLNSALYDIPVALAFMVALVRGVSLAVARRLPVIGAAGSALAGTGFAVLTTGGSAQPWPWPVMGIVTTAVTLGVIALDGRMLLASASLLVTVTATAVCVAVTPTHDREAGTVSIVIAVSIVAGIIAAAGLAERLLRTRRQLAHATVRTAEEHAARLVAEERTRIARELHDVIAHSMSVINIQALSAPARHPGTSSELRHEFEQIAAGSRRALGEMRELLGVLRDGTATERTPLSRLGDLGDLVAETARAGATVTLESRGDVERVPDLVGLAVYRIAQEGISNALRHAPGSTITVRVSVTSSAVRIAVENGAATEPIAGEPAGGGAGLQGIRERVSRLGGTMRAARAGEGYALVAELPYNPVDEEDTR